MSLEGILTFIGIILAVLALADPVQRIAMGILLPWRRILIVVGLLFAIGLVRDLQMDKVVAAWVFTPVVFPLMVAALLAATICESIRSWKHATIQARDLPKLRSLLRTALLEDKLSEAERILRANKAVLANIDSETSVLLFAPRLIAAFLNTGSPFHLELLADDTFLAAARDRFRETDLVTRELLKNENSPLRSVVNEQTRADERHRASPTEQQLISQTFQNPSWYTRTRADYGLVITAIEELNTGNYDDEYNRNGRLYEATQGRSMRASCPVYLAEKAQVLGITSAIQSRFEADLYSTNLFQLFEAILERSRYDQTVWESDLANHEHPTPYAYLLSAISADLEHLVELAITAATTETPQSWTITPPGPVGEQLIRSWSLCIWIIARTEGKVSVQFRSNLIEAYLVFILQLGWAPQDIYHHIPPTTIRGLLEWRDHLAERLRAHLVGSPKEQGVLKGIVRTLDLGKQYVQHGRPWLANYLGIT